MNKFRKAISATLIASIMTPSLVVAQSVIPTPENTTIVQALESQSVTNNVEDGIYTASVVVDHAYTPGQKSMANNAIEHTAKVVYRGDKVTIELTFKGMKLFGMKGHLTNLFFYRDNKDPLNNNDVIEAEVIKKKLDLGLDGKEHDYPQIFRYTMDKSVFEASDFLWIKVWVDAMDAIQSGPGNPIIPGAGEQNAKVVIDKTKFTKVVLNTEELSKEIKAAKDIVKGNKKVEEFNTLQSIIAEAENVLKEATDQEVLDKEVKTLKEAVKAFKASDDVKLPTEDGIYRASVEIGHASNPGQKSMANGAIEHIAKLILKEDKVKIELTFKGMDLKGMKGHLTNLFYFENNQDPKTGAQAVETKIEKTFTDIVDGENKEFPQVFSFTMDRNLFEASEFLWCRVWVDIMDKLMGGPGKGAQEARIIIDKEHLQKVVLKTEELSKEIEAAKKIEQGKKTDEAFTKLKAAIASAEETLKTATDQEALKQGVATLKAAVKAFNDSSDVLEKEALTKEIEAAKKITQGKKTDEAFSTLKEAIKAAEETLKTATDQEALNQGVATLKAAVEAFNNSPNVLEKEALTKEIEAAKKITQGKKTEEAFNTLKTAIAAAEKVLGEATEQTQLDEAVKTLKAAVKAFNESADKVVPTPLEKEALTKEIAEAKKVEQGKKTDEAFSKLQAAITTAEEVLNSATEQTQLDEAVKTLKAAVKAFNESADKVVPTPLEKEALTKEIAEAKKVEQGKKTDEAFSKLQAAITTAEEVLNSATEQTQLDEAVKTLKAAVKAFNESADKVVPTPLQKEALTKEIAEAKAIEQGKKTDEAFNNLKEAIKSAEKVLSEATEQTQLDGAVKTLKAAVKAFNESEDKVVPSPLEKEALTNEIATAKAIEQGKKTEEAFSTLKAAIKAAEETLKTATEQTQLDEAVKTLKAAVKAFNESEDKVVPAPLEKEALTNEIAEAKKVEQGKKTDEAFNTLKAAITTAEKVLGEATEQTQLDEAVKTLKAAVKAFNESADKVVPAPLEKEALTNEIAEAKKVEQGKKTDEAFNTLKVAITTAEKVLEEATEQTQLDEAVKTLKAAVKAFNESADKVVPGPTPQPEPKPQPKPSYPSYPIYPWYNHSNKVSTSKTNKNTEIKKEEVKNENLNQGKFTDINGHWANKAINYVVNKGYFAGVSKTEFAPDKPITRGEFVTVLGRMLKIDTSKYSSQRFNDVNSSTYYSPYVTWANEVGIVSGVGEGNFAPDKALTREEMAVIMSKFLKLSNKKPTVKLSTNFKDQGSISPWAKEAVTEMAKLGVVKGMGEGNFSPKTEFTRAQVAQVLYSIENN